MTGEGGVSWAEALAAIFQCTLYSKSLIYQNLLEGLVWLEKSIFQCIQTALVDIISGSNPIRSIVISCHKICFTKK